MVAPILFTKLHFPPARVNLAGTFVAGAGKTGNARRWANEHNLGLDDLFDFFTEVIS